MTAAGELPGATGADALVVEARAPAGAERPGGLGVRLDWGMLAGLGGAGAVAAGRGADAGHGGGGGGALRGARRWTCRSGVERARGVKDPALVRAFIAAARRAA